MTHFAHKHACCFTISRTQIGTRIHTTFCIRRRSDGPKSHSDSSYWTWCSCQRSWFRDVGTQHRTMFVREGSGAQKIEKKSLGENEEDRRQSMERKFLMLYLSCSKAMMRDPTLKKFVICKKHRKRHFPNNVHFNKASGFCVIDPAAVHPAVSVCVFDLRVGSNGIKVEDEYLDSVLGVRASQSHFDILWYLVLIILLNDVNFDDLQDALDPKDISAVDEQGRFVKCSVCWRVLQIFIVWYQHLEFLLTRSMLLNLVLQVHVAFDASGLLLPVRLLFQHKLWRQLPCLHLVFIEIYIYCIHCRRGPQRPLHNK